MKNVPKNILRHSFLIFKLQMTVIRLTAEEVLKMEVKQQLPYCPVLLRCFMCDMRQHWYDAHINVEFCQSVQAIRYICKYITKGPDQATFVIENENDKLTKYLNSRYICSSEATWKFFYFPIHLRYPTVIHLAVHLENHNVFILLKKIFNKFLIVHGKQHLQRFLIFVNRMTLLKHYYILKSFIAITFGEIINLVEDNVELMLMDFQELKKMMLWVEFILFT